MKTRFMHYERLQSLSGHSHVRFGKEVELEDGDDEEAVLDDLRSDINAQLGLEVERTRIREQIDGLQEEHDRLAAKIELRREELRRVRDAIAETDDFLSAAQDLGLSLPKDGTDSGIS